MWVPLLLSVCATAALPAQQEIAASLERRPGGGWDLRLTGLGDGWIADPGDIQISVSAVGTGVEGKVPLIRYAKPNELVKAKDGVAILPVVVNRNGLPPTFVRLNASGLVLDASTDGVRNRVVRASERFAYLPIQMPAPGAAPGQRFFAMPESKLDLRTEDGSAVPPERSALREMRLESVDYFDDERLLATFKLEGWDGDVSVTAERDPSAVAGLAPVVWDPVVRRLRVKYLGKPAYVYGGFLASLSPTGQWNMVSVGVAEPVRIRKIVRLFRPNVPIAFGVDPRLAGQTTTSFVTDHPLVALVDLPDGTGVVIAADEWQLERVFSPLSGFAQHPEWTPEQVAQVTQRVLSPGLDPAMAAWVAGWPSEPGTKKEIVASSRWRYEVGPAAFQTLTFRDGKIATIE